MSEYNLLDERWILVRDKQGRTRELSLLEVFKQANDIVSLANELPTLDVAILRLLLAMMHSSLDREVRDYESALGLWCALWKHGLPVEEVLDYLEKWRNRFYLFDDKYPFYQVPSLEKGTEYDVPKLLGTLSESNNKVRQFPQRSGRGKHIINYAEAARWLLYVNAFDDTSAKPTKTDDGSKRLSVGAGWLGKLGLIYAVGNTLEQTLILNFVLTDENGNPWKCGPAAWELDKQRDGERTPIMHPASQSELLTLQSRRLLLKREGITIKGYTLLGGDFFPKENAFCEQMTMWRRQERGEFVPKRHSASKQLWRDFQSLTASSGDENYRPGIVRWLNEPEINYALQDVQVRLATAFVGFGDKDFFVDDIGSDLLSFNASMLSAKGNAWVTRICELLSTTDEAVKALGSFASDLSEATGDKRDKQGRPSPAMAGKRDAAKAEAYFRLDEPFRSWLEEINPQIDKITTKLDRWNDITFKILSELGEELVAQAGMMTFIGVYPSKGSGRLPINSSIAYNRYISRLYKLLKKGDTAVYEQ